MLMRHFATILLNAPDFLSRTIPVQDYVLLIASLIVIHHNADYVGSSIKMIAKLTVLASFSMDLSSPIRQEIIVSHVVVGTIQHVSPAARQNV